MRIRIIIFISMLVGCLTLSAQGLKLFSPELHDAAGYHQRVVMDFLERYFGNELPNQRQTTREHKMADDKVYFRKGTILDLQQVSDTMPFSISLIDRYYEVEWKKQEVPFVKIVFPAQYDLLMGMQQEEAQQKLQEAILGAPLRKSVLNIPAELQSKEDGIYMSKKEMFELESLNDAIYYNKVREEYSPVFSSQYIDYSVANLLHGLIPDVDYRMYIEQSVYGMKTINYTLMLSQWLNYCSQLGMKIFFGIEEKRGDGVLAIVIAQCKELGFNHLLSIVIPDKFVNDQNVVLKVRLTPYIPTHNVKDLYMKETLSHKKKNWQ